MGDFAFSTELRIDRSDLRQVRIASLALAHGLRVATCDFHVGLFGRPDDVAVRKYLRRLQIPSPRAQLGERGMGRKNWKNHAIRHFNDFTIVACD